MSEITILRWIAFALLFIAGATCALLLFVTAPYGRHRREGWGPTLPDKLGWIVMEAPAPLVFAVCFLAGRYTSTFPEMLFFLMWETHYVHRAFVYPLTLRGHQQRMPLAIVGAGLLFNALNGYLNGRWVFTFSGGYSQRWMEEPRFIAGLALYAFGFYINRSADRTLRLLRSPGEASYKIPYGGLYRWVSSPNYLGEIIEWAGWALATWSLSGLVFFVWAAANLVPRARAHHLWYLERFPDYPKERKALVPGIW